MNYNDIKKPNVSEDLAIDLVLRIYGITITSIKRMVSYDDQNFHIKISNKHQNPYINNVAAEGYTLKITNTMRSSLPGHFESVHGALIYIHNKGIQVPLPVPNLDGNTWKLEKVPLLNDEQTNTENSEENRCGIHLFTFLPGQPVSTVTYTKSLLYQWGSLLAKFHNAAEGIIAFPYLKTKSIFWSLEHVLELKPFMEGLDADKATLISSVLDQYPEQIEKNISNLRKGFIHGDFNENNILCRISDKCSGDKHQEYLVDGVLDFEDIHYGTYTWDIGVMLAYSLLDCKTMDPLEGAGHALAGYLKYRSLDDLELSSLKMCIACRLCQSLVMGAYNHRLDPSNSYLIVSARTGWDRLEQIWKIENENLLKMWKSIEKQYDNCQS